MTTASKIQFATAEKLTPQVKRFTIHKMGRLVVHLALGKLNGKETKEIAKMQVR